MNEITVPPIKAKPSLLTDFERLEKFFDLAEKLALSPLVPAHLRTNREEGVANFVLCCDIAERLNENPLAVMQSIYFVGGKPGWAASYMISRANQSGIFSGPIRWKVEGEGNALSVTAYARLSNVGAGDDVVDANASMAMAVAEGWTKNTKYKSMPVQMLKYRSATLLIRLHCPEVMLGYSVIDELEDVAASMKDVTPASVETTDTDGGSNPVADAQVVEDKPKQTRKPAAKKETSAKPAEKKQADKDTSSKSGTGPDETKAEPEATSNDGDQADGSLIDDAEVVDGDFDISKVPDEIQGPFEQISQSYADANDIGEIEGLNDLFKEALDHMGNAHPNVRAELQSREDAAREELAARED